jgi:hypothetical protein
MKSTSGSFKIYESTDVEYVPNSRYDQSYKGTFCISQSYITLSVVSIAPLPTVSSRFSFPSANLISTRSLRPLRSALLPDVN